MLKKNVTNTSKYRCEMQNDMILIPVNTIVIENNFVLN